MLQSFDLSAYCQRIGLSETIMIDADSLTNVCQAQAFAIPFENFDIHLGRPILLGVEALTEKLVGNRRGGFCFELNGLLQQALQAFGFDVRPLLARVHFRGEHLGRTHLLSLVTLGDQRWVVDVGFGGACGLYAPALLVYDQVFSQSGQQFRFVRHPAYGTMFQALWQNDHSAPPDWKNIYSFDDQIVDAGDIAMGNYFASTSPNSIFTLMRIATKPLLDGRISLSDFELKIRRAGSETVQQLPDGEAYLIALEDYFGIKLDAPYTALRPIKKPA